MLCAAAASALEIEPGIGAGVEFTDNARLSSSGEADELIAVGYVGAKISEHTGPLSTDATASLSHLRYTRDSYPDRRDFNLGATAGWEMVKNRFDWLLQDYYTQQPVNVADSVTPDNIQDTNIFTFGANINIPVSGLHTITLLPEYRNFYYEGQTTDNQQYSLSASWNYQMYRLTSVGLSASLRTIDYDEPGIANVDFSSIYFVFSGRRTRSEFSTNIGVTRVTRDNRPSTEAFAGSLDWLLDLTSRSSLRTYLSTDLTDSGSGALYAFIDPGTGNPVFVQVGSDVIRNKVLTIGYKRRDGALNSSLTGELRELIYSESPNDSRIRSLNGAFNYPLTALLSSGLSARYVRLEETETGRTDNEYSVGANLGYSLSRKLRAVFDVNFNNKESTDATQRYNEFSAFFSLVYGYGSVGRPGRGGGF